MGIAPDAVASYVDRAVEAMADIVGDLGDDLANARPGLPGANSPYAILRHCLGVMEFWGGHVVAGPRRWTGTGTRSSAHPGRPPTMIAGAQAGPAPVPRRHRDRRPGRRGPGAAHRHPAR